MISKLQKIKPRGDKKQRGWVQRYLGSNKPTKCIKSAEIVIIAREIVKENKNKPQKIIKIVDELYSTGKIFEEIQLAGCILNRLPKYKTEIGLTKISTWLEYTYGWAETDILCQNGWDTETVLTNWSKWEKLLKKFNKDKNIHKRRASLVLLVSWVRETDDKRLLTLAFENVEKLKNEKEVLITKAISWLLRALIAHHKNEVSKYLDENKDSLPKIAVRETLNKLITGKKTIKV